MFSFAKDAASATQIIIIVAEALLRNWKMRLKPGSMHYITANAEDSINDKNWEKVHTMNCLGHFVSSTCSTVSVWAQTKRRVIKAFFAKSFVKRVRNIPPGARAEELDRHLLPVISDRSPSWPYYSDIAQRMDSLQTNLIGQLLQVAPEPDEPVSEFHRRRAKIASAIVTGSARWSEVWARQQQRWHEHIVRDTLQTSQAKALFLHQGAEWLRKKRQPFVPKFSISARAFTQEAGRLATRRSAGQPKKRYHEGLVDSAEVHENYRKRKLLNDALRKHEKTSKQKYTTRIAESSHYGSSSDLRWSRGEPGSSSDLRWSRGELVSDRSH
jgi:hypothetical protein